MGEVYPLVHIMKKDRFIFHFQVIVFLLVWSWTIFFQVNFHIGIFYKYSTFKNVLSVDIQ